MKPGRNRQVVMRLFDALLDNDRERTLSFFSDQSVFELSRDRQVSGQEAIWEALAPWGQCEWRIDSVTEEPDGAVTAERSGRLLVEGREREVRMRGRLQVSGSKITLWRENDC